MTEATYVHVGAESIDVARIVQDGLADRGNRESDGPAGVALQS